MGKIIGYHVLPNEKLQEIFYLLMNINKENSPDMRINILFIMGSIAVTCNNIDIKKSTEFSRQCIESATHCDASVRTNALFALTYLVDKELIQKDKTKVISEIFLTGVQESDINNKKNSLHGIIALIRKNQLSLKVTEKVVNLLMESAQGEDRMIGNAALTAIIELINQRNLKTSVLNNVFNLLMSLSKSEDAHIRQKVYFGIVELLEKNTLVLEDKNDIFNLLLTGLSDINPNIVETALFGVYILISRNDLSLTMSNDTLNLLVKISDNSEIGIKSLWIICHLVSKGVIPLNRLEDTKKFLEKKAKSLFDSQEHYSEQQILEKTSTQAIIFGTLKILEKTLEAIINSRTSNPINLASHSIFNTSHSLNRAHQTASPCSFI
ncbi:MAG: hypothetical protein LRY69_06410 [Gammaproteobacteria bacterium]|nr:hypothetical protein [Gammaproteobacteria bacterium]